MEKYNEWFISVEKDKAAPCAMWCNKIIFVLNYNILNISTHMKFGSYVSVAY